MASENTSEVTPRRPKRSFLPLLLAGAAVGAILASLVYSWQTNNAAARALDLQAGQFSANTAIAQHHWRHDFNQGSPVYEELFEQIAPDFATREFEAEFLVLEEPRAGATVKATSDKERAILLRLESQFKKQAEESSEGEASPADSPVFEDFYEEDAEQDYYVYYQPVYYKESCTNCHQHLEGLPAAHRATEGEGATAELPFRVVRVRMPVGE